MTAEDKIASKNFWWIYALIGQVSAALAIVKLTQYSVGMKLSAVFQGVINSYDQLTEKLLGWATPLLSEALSELGSFFRLQVQLQPHWRHVFVLVLVFWIAEIRTRKRNAAAAIAIGAAGVLISLAAALTAGVLQPRGVDVRTEAMLALIPLVIFLSATAIVAAWSAYDQSPRLYARAALMLIGGVVVVAAFPWEIVIVDHLVRALNEKYYLPSPGLVLLGVAIFGMSLVDIGRAATVVHAQNDGWPWASRFFGNQVGLRGVVMFGGFVGAILFFLLDAANSLP